MAQQPVDTVTETVTTRRDLNGQDAVSEKVVTHSAQTRTRNAWSLKPTYRHSRQVASR